MSARRLRLLHAEVTLQLVWDDGEHLSPGPQVTPQTLNLPGLRHLVETMQDQLAAFEATTGAEPANTTL